MEAVNPFKVGDRVRAIDVGDVPQLTYGNIYQVVEVSPHYVTIKVGSEDEGGFYHWRFENALRVTQAAEPETPALTGGSSDYYKFPAGATEIMDLIEHKQMSFALGNIFKACYRLGDKAGTTRKYDLEKIIFFAQRELALENANEVSR